MPIYGFTDVMLERLMLLSLLVLPNWSLLSSNCHAGVNTVSLHLYIETVVNPVTLGFGVPYFNTFFLKEPL